MTSPGRSVGWKACALWSAALAIAVLGLAPPRAAAAPPAAKAAHATPEAAPWDFGATAAFLHLTQSQVDGTRSLGQDGAGFLWIGTQNGLTRWDGYRTRNYAPSPATPGALQDNLVDVLHTDPAGRLWVGTKSGGLARYDAATDSFVAIGVAQGLAAAQVRAIAADGPGHLQVAIAGGLARVDLATDRLEPDPDWPAQRVAMAVLRDRAGTLWVGTTSGLVRRTAGSAGFEPVALPRSAGTAPVVSVLREDAAGRLWVGLRLHGAYVIDAGSTQARAVDERTGDASLASDSIRSMVEARPGEMWLGSIAGLVRVEWERGRSVRERHEPNRPSSLSDDVIYALLRDRTGLVWVGTNSMLSRTDTRRDGVATLPGGPGRAIGAVNVPAVLGLPDGRAWLATGESGIDIVDPLRGRVGRLQPAAGDAHALPKSRVLTMALGAEGGVWIGTQGGLYHAARDGTQVQRVEIDGRSPTAEVWSLHSEPGHLWVGGTDGLWAVASDGWPRDLPGARLTVRRRLGVAELGEPNVTALAAGRDRMLWAGNGGGLVRIGLDDGRVERIAANPADPGAPTGGFVSSLLVDRSGRLWAGVFGRGLLVEHGADAAGRPRFRRLGTREGLPHPGVDALVMDARGDLWVSTDGGLAHVDPATLAVRSLRNVQGQALSAYWTGAGTLTGSGAVLFGGQGGVTVLEPDTVRAATGDAAPAAVITDASADGQPLLLAQAGHGAVRSIGHGHGRIAVEFTALDFADPDRLRYAYRLRGLDGAWTEVPATRRLASYANLPPGAYTLEVRAAHADGDWGAPLALAFEVEPLWYQHRPLQAAAALLAFLLLASMWQLRGLVLRRRQRRLEALIAERTAELERQSEALRETQRRLEQLAYFDPLTGLANRRLFGEELSRLVAQVQRGGAPFALLLVDLDRFKQINDTQGHDVGDALLACVAQRLQQAARDTDRVARLGGDEFALLLTLLDSSEALGAACDRILEQVCQPFAVGEQLLPVGLSVGAALCPVDASSASELYKAADEALYAAKRAGRGRWQRWRAPARTAAETLPHPA